MTSPARKGLMPALSLLTGLFVQPTLAQAKAVISFLPTKSIAASALQIKNDRPLNSILKSPTSNAVKTQLTKAIEENFDLDQYRAVGVQVIADQEGAADHLLLQLHSLTTHRVDMASIQIDSQNQAVRIQKSYQLQDSDLQQQPGTATACPDTSVQFIAFAPNDNSLELSITQDVANAAKAKGLKTIELYKEQATRAAYLSYMSCPNLKGNFYDGDANPSLITTNDGTLSSSELSPLRFNSHVTNIWLACEAFNDPMLSTMTKDTQSQKYAAGVNDLLVGPSDRTAKCAMMAALNGQPMTQAFQNCYHSLDVSTDHWGFQGSGADFFGR